MPKERLTYFISLLPSHKDISNSRPAAPISAILTGAGDKEVALD